VLPRSIKIGGSDALMGVLALFPLRPDSPYVPLFLTVYTIIYGIRLCMRAH